MPGNHDEEEKEHKRRINKLKAKTSKMRLAAIKKKSNEQPIMRVEENMVMEFVLAKTAIDQFR